MEQEPGVENTDLSAAESQALKCWESYKEYGGLRTEYGRKSVEEAWKCGGALEEVFKELPRGRLGAMAGVQGHQQAHGGSI